MNPILFYMMLLCACFGMSAQNTRPVLSAGAHPTLDSVTVSYNPVSTGALTATAMNVKAEISVKLKASADADRIFLQVLRRADSSVVYSVNYALAAAPYTSQGELLFSGEAPKLRILCPPALPLSTYVYKLYTRSAQGTNSPVFISRQ